MKNNYDILIRDDKIMLINNQDGCTLEVTNVVDIGNELKDIFNNLQTRTSNNLMIGDKVKIVNPVYCFPTIADDFFDDEDMKNYMLHYRYGVIPAEGTNGEIIGIKDYNSITVYIVEVERCKIISEGTQTHSRLSCDNIIYLFTSRGLEKEV